MAESNTEMTNNEPTVTLSDSGTTSDDFLDVNDGSVQQSQKHLVDLNDEDRRVNARQHRDITQMFLRYITT